MDSKEFKNNSSMPVQPTVVSEEEETSPVPTPEINTEIGEENISEEADTNVKEPTIKITEDMTPEQRVSAEIINDGSFTMNGGKITGSFDRFTESVQSRTEEYARRKAEMEAKEEQESNAEAEKSEEQSKVEPPKINTEESTGISSEMAEALKDSGINMDEDGTDAEGYEAETSDIAEDDKEIEEFIQQVENQENVESDDPLIDGVTKERMEEILKEREEDFQERLNNDDRFKSKITKNDLMKMKIYDEKGGNLTRTVNARSATSQVKSWALLESGKVVMVHAANGTDIQYLTAFTDPNASSTETLNMLKTIYGLIENERKGSFMEWTKYTLAADIYNYMDAIYYATFSGSNYVRTQCLKGKLANGEPCRFIGLSDAFDILQAKNYDNPRVAASDELKEEAEKRFVEVMKCNDTDLLSTQVKDIEPLSDSIAVSFNKPTLYNVYIETKLSNEDLEKKYGDYIPMIQQIEYFFNITEDMSLARIRYKEDATNKVKTFRNKVAAYYKMLSTLSSDEYAYLTKLIVEYRDGKYPVAMFQVPTCKCEKCGAEIKGENTLGYFLLLNRARLRLPRA